MAIKIEQLTQVTTKAVEEINALIPQLSNTAKPIDYSRLLDITKDIRTTFLTAKDGAKIIGIGMIIIYNVPTEKRAWVEEVVVDEKYRGQGLGVKISNELIEVARKQRVNRIYLSSSPHRLVANQLYPKLGFEKKETNVYKLKL